MAIYEIKKAIGFSGVVFEGSLRYSKNQIAEFLDVNPRTVVRYLQNHKEEITQNGYEVLRGKRLYRFKLAVKESHVNDINVANKSPQFGVFDFRSFLNLGMLLTESENAKELRKTVLDIVIDTINKKAGGSTKYINQRDKDFVVSYFKNENYRKDFTDALRDYVDMGNFKYPLYSDKIYKSIFKEKAKEYRKLLKLDPQENVRKTLYSEVLILVSSFEFGFSKMLKKESEKKGRKLTAIETDKLYKEFEKQPHWRPLLEDARSKMASRDLCFREALHLKLEEYLAPLPKEDFEKFIGSASMNVEEQLEEFREIFKRLK